MKILLSIILFFCVCSPTLAQTYKSVQSWISFFSDAPVEDIEAINTKGKSAMNIGNGEIVFSIPIRGFEFHKSLMQQHFNENYLETDRHPNATFKGRITGYDTLNRAWQPAIAMGKMNIHGVEKEVRYDGKIRITQDSVFVEAEFPVRLEDYKIKIPRVVFYNIAEVVDVTVKFSYEKVE